MSINNFSNNPFYLVDPVTYASVGYKIYVYTGAVVDAQIIGSGDDPSLKFIAAQVNTSLAGDRSLTLTNVSVKNSVYGGIVVSTSSDPAKPKISKKFIPGLDVVLDGDTNLSVTNGKIKEIYGGGGGFGSTVTGDATIDFNGGIVNSIYGGGSHRSVVEGDVLININGGSSSDSKISKIYGGGNDSTVVGNTTIVFNPDASLLDFRGAVYGGGKGSGAIVGGTRTLVFNDYSGDFNASIKDFTNIKLSGSANVTINKPLDKSLAGATFEFYLTDETLKNVTSMLTLNKKHDNINNVTITIDSAEIIANGGEIYLITSKYFRYESSFNADNVLVLNSSGQKISQFTYTINYIFDKKDGGYVSIDYQGSSLVIDGTQTERVILSDADEEVNIIAGGHLAAGLNASGGNDTVNVQAGAEVNGGLLMGDGDDVLYIQKGSNVNGYIDMQGGNDRVVVNEEALLTSDVAMGSGTNVIDINKLAMLTGRIILTDGSVNTINVNGGAFSGIDSGDGTTFNTIVVDGTSDHAGVIGSWYDYYMPADEYHPGYYVTVFDRQDLILGDSIDDVTFCSYAEVGNIILGGGNDSLLLKDQSYVEGSIYLGGGDDYLTINSGATIDGDIYLGAGDDIVVLNQVFNGQFYADEGANVIVAKANMLLNAEALNLGSTQSVLVVANGYTVELTGMSLGNFLEIQNDATYLDQNASIVSHGQQFIQNYTGHLTVDGNDPNDLYIMAAPGNTPSQVAPFLSMISDGVVESEIMAGGNLILETGANVDQSELTVAGHSQIDGNLTDSELSGSTAALDGTVENSIVEMTGLVDINGTVSESTVDSDGVVNINGAVTDSSVSSATTLNINGVVSGSDLSGADIFINVDTFSGTLTGGAANFSADFYNSSLVVDTGFINLTTAGIVVTIASSDAAAGVFADDVQLIEVAEDQITVGTITAAIDFGTLGWTNVVLLEQVDVDMAFNGNTVTFAESMDASLFNGTATLTGDNSFVISGSAWLDWQQLIFNPGATVDFDLADYALFSVDGLVDVDPMDIVADTAFGQNSLLALGEWLYIQDWNNNFVLTDHQNPFNRGSATNLTWDNLYIVDNAEIWGGVILGNTSDDELVIGDGVVINGATALYDYAAIQAQGGMDIITVGASTINGTIDAGDGSDQLFLNNSNVNVAINQGVPAIDMGAGDDEAVITNSIVNGDIDMGTGADILTIDPSIVTGDIDLGAGDDVATIDASTVYGNLSAGDGADELSIISGSTFIGDIAMEAGSDILNITDSTVTGDISTGDDDDTIDILGSTITGDIDTGDGNDTVTITDSNTTINGNILLGDGDDEITMTNSVVNGDVSLGDGTNAADILDSAITGDLLGGGSLFDDEYVSLDNSVIIGSIDLASGGINEITAGDAMVSQDVIMGTQEDTDESIPFDTFANNTISAEGAFTIGGDLLMAGDENTIDVTGSLDVGGTTNMVASGPITNSLTIFSNAAMSVGSDLNMDSTGVNVIEFDTDVENPDGASSLIVDGAINMVGENNSILPATSNSLTEDEELIVGDITNTLQASALNMDGDTNFLGFSVSGDVNGTYDSNPDPALHVISRLELGNSTLTFDAPVTMYAADTNIVELGMFLTADQEGDIYVTGDSVITATGGFDMSGGSNEFYGGLFLNAGEQSHIVVEGDASFTVDGSVLMDATDYNYAELGLKITEFEAPDISTSDGEVDVLGSYAVTITGDFIMVGTDADNSLYLYEGVTIDGDIIMGEVSGDTVSAGNYLEVDSVGSLNTTDVTMIAEDNDLILDGSGSITSSLSLFGGVNSLTIGEDVDVQSTVAIGGVYDADQIGTEGYQIVENTANTIIVYGSIMGIDTTMDLGTPLDFVSTADDTIEIWGGTVSPNGIITGNGDDTVLVEGGLVEGGVSMGDTTFGDAVGENTLTLASVNVDDDPLLSLEANVVGDVSMESDTLNTLNIAGAVLTDETLTETEMRATIDGDVYMAALQHDDGLLLPVGTNTLDIGVAATITGGVTMYSGGSSTNSVIVTADWLKEYIGGVNDGHVFDGTSDALSLTMYSDENIIELVTGTFIINEIAGNVGISMTQDQPDRDWTGGTNTITISTESALVMYSDLVMGNLYLGNPMGAYDYTSVYLTAGGVEVFVYNYTDPAASALFDTLDNIITVGGKLFTANNDMIGDHNRIDVTGPASTNVDVSSGVYDLTTAVYQGETVDQSGVNNEILVGVNAAPSPGDALPYAEFTVSGDVNQWGVDGSLGLIVAATNLIQVANAALFNSANISQLASTSNDIIVSGYTVPMDPVGDPPTYQDQITESVINGQISQIVTAGYNNIELVNSDVNGDISQETLSPDGLYNTLSATGTALPFYVLSTPGGDDTLAAANNTVKSTITGTISQTAITGNTITLDIADVTGSISQSTETLDNSLISSGAYLDNDGDLLMPGGPAVYGQDVDGNDIWLQDAYVDENLIDGPLTQVAANGSNTAELTLTNVNGAVSQTASTGNTLSAIGQYIDSTVGSNMDGTVSLLQAQDVYWAGVNGGVTMITDTGINDLDFSLADINGALNMTASAGANDAAIEGNVFSNITMNAAQNNDLEVLGTYYPAVTGVDNLNNDLEIIDPAYVSEALVDGGITMNSATGNNTAYLDTADVTDSISMTALLGDNELDVVGRIIPAVEVPVHVPPYNNEGAELAPGQRLDATIGGGITMDATNALDTDGGSNDAYLETAIVALDVNMNAYDSNTIKVTDSTVNGSIITNAITGSNTVNIDPSTVGGDVDMDAGDSNTLIVSGEPNPAVAVEDPDTGDDILEPVTGNDPDPSTIVGNVTMDATTGSNSATFNLATVGGPVAMNAETDNTLDVDGHYYEAVIGSNADDTSTYRLLAKDIFFTQLGTDIADNVTMNTNSGNNVANVLYGQLSGGLYMNSTQGGNTADIVGDVGTDLAMLGALDNFMTLTGIYKSDPQDFGVESGNDLTVLDDPYDQISSIGGSLTMNSSGGGNTATITYGSTSSVSMETPVGDNFLTVNALEVQEVEVPPGYDNAGEILIEAGWLGSTVNGDVVMIANDELFLGGGSNTAVFEYAYVSGEIDMLAYLDNSLTITGSTVEGDIYMFAYTGSNSLLIDQASVINGTIDMVAGDNNTLTVNGQIVPAVVEEDPGTGDDVLVSATDVQRVVIDDLSMFSSGGSNTANLYIVEVTNNINMNAVTGNTLNMDGEYVLYTVGTNDDDSESVLEAQFIADSIVNGNVTMTTSTGDNSADLLYTTVYGWLDMSTDFSSNDLTLTGVIGGALTMDAEFNNTLTATGAWHYPAFGPDSSIPANEIVLPGSPGSVGNAMLYYPAEIGSVAMTANSGNNTVGLEYVEIHGLLSMDAVDGDNFLTVDGIIIQEYTSTAAPNFGEVLVPEETILSELEGGVLMNAANGAIPTDGGSNTATIGLTNVTGDVDMFAYVDNSLTLSDSTVTGSIITNAFTGSNTVDIDPSTTGNIDMDAEIDNSLTVLGEVIPAVVSQPGGPGTAEVLDSPTIVNESSVGTVSMDAVTGDNTATLTYTDSGAITLNALMYNILTVTGAEIPEVEGNDGAGGTQVLQAASIDYNVVAGDITVNSLWIQEYSTVSPMNTVSLNMAQVLGDISIDSQWGTDDPGHVANQTEIKNSVTIADSIIGDDTVPVYYDVTVTANSGTNLVDISDSVLGNLTVSSTNGYNNVTVDPSTVNGNVDMDADLLNTLVVTGLVNPAGTIEQPGGPNTEEFLDPTETVDESTVTGDVTMDSVSDSNVATITYGNTGAISMTAAITNNLSVTGYEIPEILGDDGAGDPTGKVLQAYQLVSSDVGNVVMDSAYFNSDEIGIINNAVFTLATVGDLTQTSLWGADPLTVLDQTYVINHAEYFSSTGGDISQITTSGTNALVLVDSTVGGVTMSSTYGYNTMFFDADSIVSSITGDITLASLDNWFYIAGEVIVDSDTLVETEVRATLDGNLTMDARQYDAGLLVQGVGTNTLILDVAAVTITGAIDMRAGLSNTVDVSADWIKDYPVGPAAGHVFDGTSDALSITMVSDTNTLDVNTGSFSLTEAAGTVGLSMTQFAQPEREWLGGDNTVTVDDVAAMVMYSDILMGNTVDETLIQGAYFYTIAVVVNDLENYIYTWIDSVDGIVFDTDTNTISISGKLLTGDNMMIADANVISVTGPASTTVPLGFLGSYDLTTAVYEGGLVTQIGTTNSIIVGDILSSGPTPTMNPVESAFVSGDIQQFGITAQSSLFVSDTNTIAVYTNAWFSGGSILQNAAISNDIDISGYQTGHDETDQDDPTYQDTITESLIDGAIDQTAFTTYNHIGLYTTDVNGAITQSAVTTNELSVVGEVIAAATYNYGGTTNEQLMDPAAIYESLVNGDITQDATSNTAYLELVDVTGGIAMTAGTTNDLDILGRRVNATIGTNLDTSESLLEDTILVDSLVALDINLDAGSGNDAYLDMVQVGGDMTVSTSANSNNVYFKGDLTGFLDMNAPDSNTLLTDGEIVNIIVDQTNINDVDLLSLGYVDQSTIGGPVTLDNLTGANSAIFNSTDVGGNITLTLGSALINHFESHGYHFDTEAYDQAGFLTSLQDQFVAYNTITGNILLTTTAGSNEIMDGVDEGMSYTDVTGSLTMTTTSGDNDAFVVGSSFGSGVTMTTVTGSNDFESAGNVFSATTRPNFLVDDNLLVEGSITGALSQTTTSGSNTADLYLTNVDGSINQTTETGNNTLDFAGDIIPAIVNGTELKAEQTVISGIDGSINMDALNDAQDDGGWNLADVDLALITNSIDMLALLDNDLTVTDSEIYGSITTTSIFGDNNVSIDPSTVGNVIMDAAQGDNTLITDGGTPTAPGPITQPGGPGTEQFLNIPATVELSSLDAVNMNSDNGWNDATIAYTDTNSIIMTAEEYNSLDMTGIAEILGWDDQGDPTGKVLQEQYGTVSGNISMDSDSSYNDLIMNGVEVTGSITLTGNSSRNDIDMTDSIVGGGIALVDTGSTLNTIDIAGSTVSGGIDTGTPRVTITISNDSTITGGIVTGDLNDTFTVGIANPDTSSVDSITAGDGDDYLEIGVNGMVSSINMGLGDDTVYINRDDYNISLIDTTTEGNESITIVGTSTDFTVEGATFGAIDVNTVVEDASFNIDSTITFNYAGGAGTTIAGNIDTVSGAHSVTTILDATGLAKGGADLIAVANDDPTFTSWDLLNVCGQGELELVMGNYDTNANDVFDLVSGYEGSMNLSSWTASSITLTHTNTSGDTETITLDHHGSVYYDITGDWTLGVNLSGTDDTLQLAYQLAP